MTSPHLTTDQKQAIPADILSEAKDLAHILSTPMAHWEMADLIGGAILAERQKHDLPTSPDLQAEAERVFANVQREVQVEDAKAMIAKALQAVVDAERERCAKIAEPPLMHRVGNHGLWRVRRAQIAADIRAQGN